MGPDVSGPELVAAVANAGGLGLLASPVNKYDETVKAIREIKKLTKKPFGAGILLEFDNSKTIQAIYDEKIAFIQVYWGEFPKEKVDEAHKHGVKVLHQLGSVEAAKKAIAAGVDCIIAQGVEAGGHVIGTVSLMALLPRIVDLVGDRGIPVVAAGSISDARGYAAALALGAKGICVGTRFIATKEAYANEYYKQQLLHYTEQQTDRTDLYGRKTWRAYVRCLSTPFHENWKKSKDYDKLVNDETQPIIARSIIYNKKCEFRRFAGQVANPTTTGQLENMCMLAGQGVGLVYDIVPAAEIVKRFVEGVKAIMVDRDAGTSSLVPSTFESDSDVCWETFLLSDYKDIISRSSLDSFLINLNEFSSKKQLYLHLCDHPLLLDGGKMSFNLDKKSGKKCFMIAAKELKIVWGNLPSYWRWKSQSGSRFAEVAELVNARWLEIKGIIETKMLSPKTDYAAYIVVKFADDSSGLDTYPADVSVEFVGGAKNASGRGGTVHLDPKRGSGGQFPSKRGDGWMEIELGGFFNEKGEDGEVEMTLEEIKGNHWKSGLIVQGIEVRPRSV
ncbi:hypothetical protein AQUCO_03400279v1 [Aquilegia coerulea]|uniref:Uncharacterized protein n=1 Tax=Aquilegia coerulea TaxID=218851 RepID=A0A2G5CYA0_AQUCA|nr:hypothetical protein AQUCO_03400279v1 [Aquilegia coerulea]